MADGLVTADMTILKNSQILVNVEEASADLIVVSYNTENKQFHGVLLDSNKSHLPFGVYSLNPAFTKTNADTKDDRLHTVSQRFVYQEPQYAKPTKPKPQRPQQKQKMTVRLRPRKVLCSKCKGICNENSENVDVARKRKSSESDSSADRRLQTLDVEKKFLMGSTLIPKLSRLNPTEISNALKGSKNKLNENGSLNSKESSNAEKEGNNGDINRVTRELTFVNVSDEFAGKYNCDITTDKGDGTRAVCDSAFSTFFSNPKRLKICFGEGEGTVVKIPILVGDYNEDSGVCDLTKQTDSKAAKKALKKAKKQAKKISNNQDHQDQVITLSPKHIGALSPRNNVSDKILFEDSLEKKHKHKQKHKKKHKLEKKQIRDENSAKTTESSPVGYFTDIKQHSLKQKLSISLRRLSRNSYERRSEDAQENAHENGSEDWESDLVPEFPATGTSSVRVPPLRVSPGDIVWGKVVGFPWWPGRVISVTASSEAHVAWYASTTSSLMRCDTLSPFLEDYKVRFNKKKKGMYREAVKQATREARQTESHNDDPLASPAHGGLPTASPRPIDVFS